MDMLISGFSKSGAGENSHHVTNPSVNLEDVPEFVTHLPPPVTPTTRIIAVCGIIDSPTIFTKRNFDVPVETKWDPVTGSALPPSPPPPAQRILTGYADPRCDGWFISDFYFFMNLLQDTGAASETWITTERPLDLVKKYKDQGPYLRGTPYYERKVVLSEDLLLKEGLAVKNMIYPNHDNLKACFIEALKEEAAQAKALDQRLLILTFCHGHEETKGVWLGNNLLVIEEFQQAVGPDVQTTIFSTACFSGGWVVRRDLNRTVFAAAGPKRSSLSWNASVSMHRYCSGVHASAFLKAWEDEVKAELEQSGLPAPTPMDSNTSLTFTREVYEALFKTDRLAKKHDIRFSAQDDNWGSEWTTMSGFPLIDFEARYKKLEVYEPTASELSFCNRDPRNPNGPDSSDSDALASSATGMRERFGTGSVAVSYLKKQAQFYFSSFPGADNEAPNTGAHYMLRALLNDQLELSDEELADIEQLLTFRLSLSAMATELLAAANIPRPEGKRRCEFNLDKFERWCDKNQNNLIAKNYDKATDLCFQNVLPDPARGTSQGPIWNKPRRYLAAGIAFASASVDKNAPTVKEAVERIEKAYKANVQDVKGNLDRDPNVRGRKSSYWQKLGKRLRSLSPKKAPEMRHKRATTLVSGYGMESPVSSPPKLAPSRKSLG